MNGAQVHLLVSHVPVIGAYFVWALLVAAAWRGDRSLWQAGAAGAVVMALTASLAMTSGPVAQEIVRPWLDEDGLRFARSHEIAGQIATAALALVAVLAVQAILSMGPRGPRSRRTVIAVLVTSTLAVAASTWTGAAGGRIRHVEARSTFPAPESFTDSPLDSTGRDRAGSP